LTGYSTISGSAGNVTEIEIIKYYTSSFWGGIYGIALRATGFGELLSSEVSESISRQDLFF
jgi:Leu/Phe-tRNA-protein transferase